MNKTIILLAISILLISCAKKIYVSSDDTLVVVDRNAKGWPEACQEFKERNKEKHIREMELELLEQINSLNIGSGGLGGKTTTLAVNIETAATHTAICPVVVNFHCWAARRAGVKMFPNGNIEWLEF